MFTWDLKDSQKNFKKACMDELSQNIFLVDISKKWRGKCKIPDK